MTGTTSAICSACGRLVAVLAESAQSPVAATAPALGSHAARGVSLMIAQGLATRVVSLICQMALSYLLMPEHFGLLAMADAIAVLAGVLQLIGVREILVSRQKRFHLWANACFWLMTFSGLVAAAIITGAAPLMARAYDNPQLAGMLYIIALSIPFSSMSVVGEAKLQAELRFKYLACVLGVWAVLLPTLTIVFALLGFGPYSFVLPRVIVAVLRLAMVQRAARLRLRWNPQFRRWRFILGTSALVFVTSLLLIVIQVGDRTLLSLFVDERALGLYIFAYSFSLQVIMMISINLQGVLFATLAKLNDERDRQLRAFVRASRVLATVVAPICLVQAAASESIVRTLFDYDKWKDSVPAMQALAIGMVFMGAYCPTSSLLESQRRFKTKFKLTLLNAALFVSVVFAGIALGIRYGGDPLGGIVGAAIGVAVTLAIVCPIWSYVALRNLGGGWADALGIAARPLIASGIAVAIGLACSELAGRAAAGRLAFGYDPEHWVRLATITGFSGLAYAVLSRVLLPAEFGEIAQRLISITRRFSPRAANFVARATATR